MLRAFLACKEGATAVEYALIAAVLVLAIVAGATEVGRLLGASFDNTAQEVVNALE